MSDQDALYRSIIATPGDNTPRLVYADWLQENDRPDEAELIRVQCRLDAEPPDHPDFPELLAREEELKLWLSTHLPGPTPTLSGGLTVESGARWWLWTRRGFPRFLDFDGINRHGLKPIRTLAAGLSRAFAMLPTRWLVVRFVTVAQLTELLNHPVMEAVERITVQLSGDQNADAAARAVAESLRLRNLRGAALMFPFGAIGAEALARSPHLGKLEWLWVSADDLSGPAIRSLCAAPWFRALQALYLEDLPEEAFVELLGAEAFPNLRRLGLVSDAFPTGWRGFARSKAFPNLTALELPNTPMVHDRMAGLASATGFNLTSLDLRNAAIGNDGAEALEAASWFGSLRWLNLAGNSLTPGGVATITKSRKLTELKHLDLGYNAPGAGGLRGLAANPALRGLIALDLRGNTTGREIRAPFDEFLTKLDMPQLRHLCLNDRPIGARTARLLIDEKFKALTCLELANCNLTNSAVAALIAAPALQNLVQLNLNGNGLRDGLQPLMDHGNLPRLSKCNIGENPLDDLRAKLLRRPGVRTD